MVRVRWRYDQCAICKTGQWVARTEQDLVSETRKHVENCAEDICMKSLRFFRSILAFVRHVFCDRPWSHGVFSPVFLPRPTWLKSTWIFTEVLNIKVPLHYTRKTFLLTYSWTFVPPLGWLCRGTNRPTAQWMFSSIVQKWISISTINSKVLKCQSFYLVRFGFLT